MENRKKEYDLAGKNIIVTGATSGIGLAAASKFVASGAYVIGIGRSALRNEKAEESILSLHPNGKVRYLLADLASQTQVRSLADDIKRLLEEENRPYVNLLVNNAGVFMEKKHKTEDSIEMTFAVNHLAPFLLTHELLPLLNKAECGRVLAVSSYSHYTTPLCLSRIVDPSPYISLLAYKRSKLSNVLFIYELNRRYDRLEAFAVDPGLVNTDIAAKGGQGIANWVWRSRRKQGTPTDVPVKTILYLSGEEEVDTKHGYYYKDCKPKTPSRNARRPDLAKQLWTLSCRLTAVKED